MMLMTYKSSRDGILEIRENFEKNSWINITTPSKEEVQKVSQLCNIPIEFSA